MSDAAALKDLGNKAFSAKDYDKAIELFTSAIEIDPKNHVLYSNRSAARAGKRQWTEALADAEETIRVNPSWSKGYARKGAALHGAKKWDEAIAAYEEGVKLEGDKPSPALAKGLKEVISAREADEDRGNPLGNVFRDPNMMGKLAANPKTAPFLADPAFVQKLQGISQSSGLPPDVFSDQRMIQVMGVLMGIDMSMRPGSDASEFPQPPPRSPSGAAGGPPEDDWDPPAPEVPRAAPTPSTSTSKPVKKEPEPEPMEVEEQGDKEKKEALEEKSLGAAAYKSRNFADAEMHFSKAWDLWPQDITFLTNLAAVYFEQGAYEKSIETCEKAIEEGRSLRADYKLVAKAYGRIGSSYTKLENYDSAIKSFNKSLTEHRTADVLNKLKEVEKVKKERDAKAYEDPAKSAEAREEGNKLFKGGDFAGSVKSYSEAIKRDPRDPRGYTNRAAAYHKLAAFPEALKDSNAAIDADKSYVKAYIRKSLVLTAMRETTKAMEALQAATDADTEHKHTAEIESNLQKLSTAMYNERASETEEQTLQRAMRDPEVAGIMNDPVMQQILQQAQQDPKALMDHMKNPSIRDKINKLVAAGIIKTR